MPNDLPSISVQAWLTLIGAFLALSKVLVDLISRRAKAQFEKESRERDAMRDATDRFNHAQQERIDALVRDVQYERQRADEALADLARCLGERTRHRPPTS